MLYREWILTPGPDGAGTPPFLVNPNGIAWLVPIGRTLDDQVERARQAVKACFPLICPADALPVLGDEFSMPRGTVEPEDQYRDRLARAWVLWPWSGTGYGMLSALYWAGYLNISLRAQTAREFELNVPPTGDPLVDVIITNLTPPVHLGGAPELWPQFIVLIREPWPTWWGGVVPVDGSEDQKAFSKLLLAWKSAYSICLAIRIVDDEAAIVGDELIVDAFDVGDGAVVEWTPPIG